MAIIASKSGKLLKVAGIAVLLLMSIICTIPVDSNQRKKMRSISCDGDDSETIIVTQDRQRTRVFLDIHKKLTFLPSPVQYALTIFRDLSSVERKSLFVNSYQRNVFYVFAFSTVP